LHVRRLIVRHDNLRQSWEAKTTPPERCRFLCVEVLGRSIPASYLLQWRPCDSKSISYTYM
jgi:hypothetical protein